MSTTIEARNDDREQSSDIQACAGNIAPSSSHVVNKFWKRVAELTTRYHDVENKWIGCEEVKQWNRSNRTVIFLEWVTYLLLIIFQACKKCLSSKAQRTCIIDEDHPSCRACRDAKVGCDRKPQYIFDLTKDDFFSDYQSFLEVYNQRQPTQMRKLKQAENAFRSSPKSRDAFSTRRKYSFIYVWYGILTF